MAKTRFFSILKVMSIFFVGILLGLMSQRIPEWKKRTDAFLQPLENRYLFKNDKIAVSPPQPVILKENLASQENPQLPVSLPQSLFLIKRQNYSLAYDARNRNPLWVYENITAGAFSRESNPVKSDFKVDESLPEHLRSSLADYRAYGLDRGLMASPKNAQSHPNTLQEAYYLTNVCPQCPQFNRVYWDKMEQRVRDLAKRYQNVHVISGPLYLPYEENGARFVKYRLIGPNDVAVPSHFFKVITLVDQQGKKETLAYILPNYEIAPSTPIDNFRTTVKKIEKAAGILFP